MGASLEPDCEPPAGVARLAAVQSRIQQARHHRVAAVGSACAVILALVLGYAINPVHRTNPHPAASPSSSLINGFPEYQLGTRLVATATATAAQPKVLMAWTASTPDLTFFLRCGASTLVTASVVVSTGNGELGEMACEARPDTPATGGGSGATWPVERMVKAGVTKGAQVEMSVSVAVERGITTPSDLSVAVAVGERVSWSEYPFPAKPASLAPLDSNQLDQRPGVITLRPPDSEPQVSASATLTWGKRYEVHFSQRAPGILRLEIEGVAMTTCTSWAYAASGCGFTLDPIDPDLMVKLTKQARIKPGQLVRVGVVPEQAAADWAVWIAPSA